MLLNQVDVDKTGQLVAADGARFWRYGAAEGEHKVRVSGITEREFTYRTSLDHEKTLFQASIAMRLIGRSVHIQCMEDAAACIVKSVFFYPVVMVFYREEDTLRLVLYTARAFLSAFAVNSALNKFDRQLSGEIVRNVSIHSSRDVMRSVRCNLGRVFKKGGDAEAEAYVELVRHSRGDAKRRKKKGLKRRGRNGTLEAQEQTGGKDPSDLKKPLTRAQKKEKKKADRLEKKKEAARRKYEKLMAESGELPAEGTVPAGYGTDGAETAGYGTEAAGYGAEAAGYGAETAGYGTEAAGYGAETVGYGTEAAGYAPDDGSWNTESEDGGYDESESDAIMRELTGMSIREMEEKGW